MEKIHNFTKMDGIFRINSMVLTYCALYVLSTLSHVYAEFCPEYGHSCEGYQRCCGQTCCIPTELENHYQAHLRWSVWNMWYFWFVVLFVLMSCFGGCSYYRRHQLMMARQQSMLGTNDNNYSGWRFPSTFPVSLFNGYDSRNQPLRGARGLSTNDTTEQTQTAAFPTPPPYSEVMSQPDTYPPSNHSNPNKDLPPYPGPQSQYPGATVPPYLSTVPQLPPYPGPESDPPPPPAGTGSHGNRNQQDS